MILSDVKNELKGLDQSEKALNRFVLSLSIVFLGLGLWFYFTEKVLLSYIFSGLLLTFVLIGAISKKLLAKLYKYWMAVAFTLGWIVSRIILVLVYYLVLTPISLIFRMTGKEFLPFMKKNSSDSYWIEKSSSHNSMEKLY